MRTKPINRDTFQTIRHGDIIFTGGDRKVPRLVLVGPADGDTETSVAKMCVWFPIHRRSWTNRAYTLYFYNDLIHVANATRFYRPKTARDICGIERDILRRLGFDWIKDVRAEIEREREFNGRLKRNYGIDRWFPHEAVRWLERFAKRAERKRK